MEESQTGINTGSGATIMKRICAGFVLGLLACVFAPSVCCGAADTVVKAADSTPFSALAGTWNVVYTPVPPPPPTTNNIPPPDNITLTFSAGMTNPDNGIVFGTVTGVDGGVAIHNGNWDSAAGGALPVAISYISSSVGTLENIFLSATTVGESTMSGTYFSGDLVSKNNSGTFTATKPGGGGKPPPPPTTKSANVKGTWLFELKPDDSILTANILNFSSADALGNGTAADSTSGAAIATYSVSNAQITITTSGSSLTLTGSVTKDGMSGSYSDNAGGSGTWSAVQVTPPKFLGTESLGRIAATQTAADKTKTALILDEGKFSISLTVPVPADVVATLNGQSTFNVVFGGLSNNNAPISFSDDSSYAAGATTLNVKEAVNGSGGFPTLYSLSWSGKNTLKIKVTGSYYRQILPFTQDALGVSPQAASYIEGSSESTTLFDQKCVITFGAYKTTLDLGSVIVVQTASGTVLKNGLTYTPSKVSIGTTIPKASK
ncbi:MAG TPA: hypothetical protein VKX17_04390 [Planctomycetota bacterium]|nr:hypothetical protein [Planctomycetota bacterium]